MKKMEVFNLPISIEVSNPRKIAQNAAKQLSKNKFSSNSLRILFKNDFMAKRFTHQYFRNT